MLCNVHPVTEAAPGWCAALGRSGQGDRYRPLFRHLRQCGSVAARAKTGPAAVNPATGKPLRRRFLPAGDDRRHGGVFFSPGWGGAPWLSRTELGIDDPPVCHLVARLGGMQVLELGGSLIRAGLFRHAVWPASPAPFGAPQTTRFHEVGRQADDGRSRLGLGALSRTRHPTRKGARRGVRMAAHVTYLSEVGIASEIRSQAAKPRAPTLLFSMPISRSRASCAIQGSTYRRAFRRETPISTSPVQWIISTSQPSTTANSRAPSGARRRGSA